MFEFGLSENPQSGLGHYYYAEVLQKLNRSKQKVLEEYSRAAELLGDTTEGIEARAKAALLKEQLDADQKRHDAIEASRLERLQQQQAKQKAQEFLIQSVQGNYYYAYSQKGAVEYEVCLKLNATSSSGTMGPPDVTVILKYRQGGGYVLANVSAVLKSRISDTGGELHIVPSTTPGTFDGKGYYVSYSSNGSVLQRINDTPAFDLVNPVFDLIISPNQIRTSNFGKLQGPYQKCNLRMF